MPLTLLAIAGWPARAALAAAGLAVGAVAIASARDSGAIPDVGAICRYDADAAKAAAQSPVEAAFLAENDAAMTKMMADMAARPSGDVDRDFVAMMAPHHQGAVDMAVLELRYGENEQLKRLAQEIIVTQQQEIAAMYLAIGDPLPPSVPAPTQAAAE